MVTAVSTDAANSSTDNGNNLNWDFGATSAPYFSNLRARIGGNSIYVEFNKDVYNQLLGAIGTNNFIFNNNNF